VKGRDFALRWWAVPRPRSGPAPPASEDRPGELLVIRGHTGSVRPVAFAPDGEHVLTGGWDGTVQLGNAETGDPGRQLARPAGMPLALGFTPDGKVAFGANTDGIVRQWDVATGKAIRAPFHHVGQVWGLACSPDGKRLAIAGGPGQSVVVRDLATGGV